MLSSLCLCQFAVSMLGNRSKDAVGEFWEHCLRHDEWKDHPAFADPLVDKKSTILSEVSVRKL